METDPAYYRNFSQMIEETLQAIEQERMSELEALELAESLREQETSGYRQDIPQPPAQPARCPGLLRRGAREPE